MGRAVASQCHSYAAMDWTFGSLLALLAIALYLHRRGWLQGLASGWMTVGRWSGTGPGWTDVFEVKSSCWRLRWQADGGSHLLDGILQGMLYRSDGTAVVNAFLPNTAQAATGTVYVDEGPGQYFMMLHCVAFEWEIVVEEPAAIFWSRLAALLRRATMARS